MATVIPVIVSNNFDLIWRQKSIECREFMLGYQHATASHEQIQYYADCAKWLYPASTNTMEIWLKACIISVFIGIILGIWISRNDAIWGESWYARAIGGAVTGLIIGLLFIMTIAGIYYGALFLMKSNI